MGVGLALTGVAIVGCALSLWVQRFFNERKAWTDWETLLSGKGRRVYQEAADRIARELQVVDLSYGHVQHVRQTGSIEEAVRILPFAYEVLADTAPSMGALLVGLSKLSRMVSAFAPTSPLSTEGFLNLPLKQLGRRAALLRYVALSASQQFRLRTYILGRGCATITRYMLLHTRRLEGEPRADSPSWTEIESLLSDWHTVSDETLASLRALVASAERHQAAR